MNFEKKLKKWLNSLFDTDRLDYAYHPWSDWRIIVIIFLVGEIIIFSSHYFFYQWSAVELGDNSTTDQSESLIETKNKLDSIFSRYQGQQQELEKIGQKKAATTN